MSTTFTAAENYKTENRYTMIRFHRGPYHVFRKTAVQVVLAVGFLTATRNMEPN